MGNPFFILLICSLGVWRGSELVAFDSGPFRIFKHLRDSCKGHPVLCELVTCPYCVSGYLSLAAAIWLTVLRFPVTGDRVFDFFLWWGGSWGLAMAIMRAVRERE